MAEQNPASLGQDVQNAAKEGAQTAKSAVKIAKNIASQNYVGAAIEALKNPNVIKNIFILCFTILLMFYAVFALLPLSIFENGISMNDAGITYGSVSTNGAIDEDKLAEAEAKISDTLDDVDEDDFTVFEDEESVKKILKKQVDMCKKRIDGRIENIAANVENDSNIANYLKTNKPNAQKVLDESNKDAEIVVDGVSFTSAGAETADYQAVKLLALYSAQMSTINTKVTKSGFSKWLGNSSVGSTKTLSYNLGGVEKTVKAWKGSFMPQYLVEQQQIDEQKGQEDTYDYKNMGCSAVDLLMTIDVPDLDTLVPTITQTEFKEVTREEVTEVEHRNPGNTMGVEKRTEKITEQVPSKVHVQYTVPYFVGIRDVSSLLDVVGLAKPADKGGATQ